ncbi:MAG: type 4a pilus biogenesis protein PilO [Firmicutes bacterium]|nr:type 4a pilus biogenesis protein PilO [Bacillota bacterium]
MTKKNNLSTIIFIILIILISGGIIAGGVHYLLKNNELKQKINQRESELLQMKQKVATLPLLREQSKTGIAEIYRLQRFAPSREEQAAFVLELERIARNCKVDIIFCKIDDQVKNFRGLPNYQVYQWAVELNGEYHGIKRFLESILESKRFMMVSGLNINASEPDSESRKAYELNTQLILDLIAPVEQGKVNP